MNIGDVVELVHESGNIYIGEVKLNQRLKILYAQTKFYSWAIALDELSSKGSRWKSSKVIGKMPEDSGLLELSKETLEYIEMNNKMSRNEISEDEHKKFLDNYRKK